MQKKKQKFRLKTENKKGKEKKHLMLLINLRENGRELEFINRHNEQLMVNHCLGIFFPGNVNNNEQYKDLSCGDVFWLTLWSPISELVLINLIRL